MSTDFTKDIDLLLDEIRDEARDTGQLTGRPVFAPQVLAALRRVPRQDFVPGEFATHAYANHPLPIGHGQTISQPYIVALMTDLMRLRPDDVVLEIGTGSGYQAAVLSLLVKQVYTIEIVAALAADARARLRRLGYDNVEVCSGNGRLGWPAHAPYDAIAVTAAAERIPAALIGQLKPGGSLVIPLGEPQRAQELLVLAKRADGGTDRKCVLPVAFVPLTGAEQA